MEINGKNYNPKYGLRAMFIFEEMAGKSFEITSLLDTYVFCYSCILADKDNPALEFDAFIDACDKNPGIIEEFNNYMADELKKRSAFGDKKKVTEEEKN